MYVSLDNKKKLRIINKNNTRRANGSDTPINNTRRANGSDTVINNTRRANGSDTVITIILFILYYNKMYVSSGGKKPL